MPNEISRRDYFAAHAPEVPHWFRFEFDEPAPERPQLGFSASWSTDVHGVPNVSATNPRRQEILDHAEAVTAYDREYAKWQARKQFARMVAWNWTYADKMLEGEPKSDGCKLGE